jgi:predicted transcriptional regulator
MTNNNVENFIDPASVDFLATQHRLRMITYSRLAREIGENHETVRRIVQGSWADKGKVLQKVLGKLDDLGFLVRKTEEMKAA